MDKLNRNITSLKLSEEASSIIKLSEAELFLSVWELTKELWYFSGREKIERRLQRDVATLIRRGS